ncbi:hypothetical protein [Nocardia veterana]|uniref:Secreted protein n=1 Tax=Nocardia veterana TaxID=132249 RepID=A0A7X6LZT7_9NOCA|nr:hypothetical protein [Nocardia veterana]NKY87196.1 hypothetical protein [Nocardia veterana]
MGIKSKLVKLTAAGALTAGLVGLGAGIAAADPGPQQPNEPGRQQQHDPRPQNTPGPDHHDQDSRPAGHGFWFFGNWVPLP